MPLFAGWLHSPFIPATPRLSCRLNGNASSCYIFAILWFSLAKLVKTGYNNTVACARSEAGYRVRLRLWRPWVRIPPGTLKRADTDSTSTEKCLRWSLKCRDRCDCPGILLSYVATARSNPSNWNLSGWMENEISWPTKVFSITPDRSQFTDGTE